MGQGCIKSAIARLGGRATAEQIRAELRRTGASPSLQKTLGRALTGLHKRYEVERVQESGVWYYHLL